MSAPLNNPVQESGTLPTQAASKCEGETCRTGVCSPCLIVWGLVAAALIIKALLERFQ